MLLNTVFRTGQPLSECCSLIEKHVGQMSCKARDRRGGGGACLQASRRFSSLHFHAHTTRTSLSECRPHERACRVNPEWHSSLRSAPAPSPPLSMRRRPRRRRRAAMGRRVGWTPPGPPPPPALDARMPAAWLLFWLLVAAAVPIMVALLGVFARYLQVSIATPFPPLRFTSMLNILALPTLLLFYTLPHRLLGLARKRRRRRRQLRKQGSGRAEESGAGGGLGEGAADASDGSSLKLVACKERPSGPDGGMQATRDEAADGDVGRRAGSGGMKRSSSEASSLRALPGLSRLHRAHPRAHRAAVILVASSFYEVAILGQNVAPALVDPAVVMLVSMFTVVGVAVLARLWLKTPLRWLAVAPAVSVMIGGAAMVLVPNMKAGAGEPGSLTTVKGWLGFGASVGAMLGNVFFIVLAQAYRDSNLTAIETQYTIVYLNLLIILPISLGVDGTDWKAQLGGMNGKDWGALVFCGCVAHPWIALLMQECTVRLGGLTVSLFFGLRLIGSVAASKVVLGVTIVQTGVQIAGIVLVAFALTAYTAVQWRSAARPWGAGAGGGTGVGAGPGSTAGRLVQR